MLKTRRKEKLPIVELMFNRNFFFYTYHCYFLPTSDLLFRFSFLSFVSVRVLYRVVKRNSLRAAWSACSGIKRWRWRRWVAYERQQMMCSMRANEPEKNTLSFGWSVRRWVGAHQINADIFTHMRMRYKRIYCLQLKWALKRFRTSSDGYAEFVEFRIYFISAGYMDTVLYGQYRALNNQFRLRWVCE